MGKTRRNSNTNSGRTSHDATTSTNLMNNMMSKNPMHTHESGAQGVNNLIGGMMSNMDGFVDKMDSAGCQVYLARALIPRAPCSTSRRRTMATRSS